MVLILFTTLRMFLFGKKMKIKCIRALIFISIPLALISCDLDKFVGYNYDAESLIGTVQISGLVTNSFTGLHVKNARIQFGNEATYSDIDGNYLIVYPLGTDEERNKIIPITVSAENYFQYADSTIIYPENKEFNFSLVYAAPIIESSSLVSTTDSAICYATIFDYQGIADIATAFTVFSYLQWPLTATRMMQIDSLDSENRAIYRCSIAIFDNENGGINTSTHKITVFDKEGFSDSRTF